MVCLSNICRSTLAEGILTKKCDQIYVIVDSACRSPYHIEHRLDTRSINIAIKNNIIIQKKALQIYKNHLTNFDLIFAMDVDNYINM